MSGTHFIGIGGTGLSAIARVLLDRGETVTGSDRQDSPLAELLRQAGVRIAIGHAAENVNGAERVVRSSAVPDDNVEVQAALAKGIPVLKRADFLEDLLAGQDTIAIAGSHGKTTTTAMVAWMLSALDQDPGYIIGSVAPNLGGNAAAGGGRYFVIEADEYDLMFHGLHPALALVTNVEYDHPDFFTTPQDFVAAFQGFVDRVKEAGALIICLDDPGAAALGDYARSQGIRVVTYGFTAGADYSATGLVAGERGFNASAVNQGAEVAQLHLQVPGAHNAQNALGALVVADQMGLNLAEAALALESFQGTGRRLELRGEAAGVLVMDSYAHHPTEIRADLAAARAQHPTRRLWAVWQPHTYSRTLTLLDDFGAAFTDADQVVVLPVYAAREQAPDGFAYEQVLHAVQHEHVHSVTDFDDALQLFADELEDGDLVLIMSAGDAIQLSEHLFAQLEMKEQA